MDRALPGADRRSHSKKMPTCRGGNGWFPDGIRCIERKEEETPSPAGTAMPPKGKERWPSNSHLITQPGRSHPFGGLNKDQRDQKPAFNSIESRPRPGAQNRNGPTYTHVGTAGTWRHL